MKISRKDLKKLIHSATNNIKDFVTNEDDFIDDFLKRNEKLKNKRPDTTTIKIVWF